MSDSRVQAVLDRVAAGEKSQELRQQVLLLEEKRQLMKKVQQAILLLERAMLLLPTGNENQTFLCVLVLIFVEALDGITHL